MSNTLQISEQYSEKSYAEYMANRIWQFLLYYYHREELRERLILNIYGKPMEIAAEFISALRLHVFFHELVTTIIPLIKRRINFEENEIYVPVTEGLLKGRISWPETLLKWKNIPREIHCLEPFKVFTIPENILTTLTILEVKQNCYELKRILDVALATPNFFMHRILEQLLGEARRAIALLDGVLQTPQLRAAVDDAKKYQGNEMLIKFLEASVEKSVYSRTKTSIGYILLLRWRRKFKQQISFLQKELRSHYAVLRIPVPKLYEIYGLLEIVNAFCRILVPYEIRFDANQATVSIKSKYKVCSIKIYYNKTFDALNSWVANATREGLINGPIETGFTKGIPDTILEIQFNGDKKQFVVLDYKFSSAPTYITMSRYKILGYMNEYDIPVGVLIIRKPSIESEKIPEELNEEEVRDTIQTVSRIDEKGGVLLADPGEKRKLILVILEPRNDYEKRNEEALRRAMDKILSLET
ncbi:MAG: hypothetical protein QXN36_05235 [Candidatus Bathyarchaeia archaeon]